MSSNWFRMIQSFNAVSQWVVSVVLSAQLPSQRAEYIVYFLKIADHLLARDGLAEPSRDSDKIELVVP